MASAPLAPPAARTWALPGLAAERVRRGRARWWRRARFAVLLLLLFAALLVLAVQIGAGLALHPPRLNVERGVARFPFAAALQEVRFPSADGTPLAGWFLPGAEPRRPTIILLPGYGQTRAALLGQAAYLHEGGYNVLLVDLRGTGESGGAVTFGIREPLDVQGATTYLRSRPDVDPSRIAVQGVSLGASAGLLATADDQQLKAAVAESSFSDLDGMIARDFQRYSRLPAFPFATLTVALMQPRLGGSVASVRPVDAVAHFGARPVLLISDGRDQLIPPGSARALYAAASGPKELWQVPSAAHASGFAVEPAEYARRVLAFYATYLGGTGAAS